MTAVRIVEGVPWHPFVVRYTLADGRRRRMILWSPGYPWVRMEAARTLADRYTIDGIKPGSVTVKERT